MKRAYVATMRALRALLRSLGLLRLLDRAAERSRTALWIRSWLAIYDLDDLQRLGLPWWTFEAVDKVDAFLRARPRARVFEWGSGVSTLWLAERGAQVTSVEHDPEWAARMQERVGPGARLLVVPPTPAGASAPEVIRSGKAGFGGLDFRDYVAAIDTVEGTFDVIVIDGRAREACLERAVHRLAPGGIIVFDDTERRRYAAAIEEVVPRAAVDWTRGRTPTVPYPCDTALITLSGEPAA